MFCIPIQQMCVSMQEFIKHCYFFIGISLSLCPFIIWQLASCRIKSIFSRTFKINNYLSFSIFFNYLSLNLPFKATHFYIITVMDKHRTRKCQCPLGLMTHFYAVYSLRSQSLKVSKCQCPLGLMTHFYTTSNSNHE